MVHKELTYIITDLKKEANCCMTKTHQLTDSFRSRSNILKISISANGTLALFTAGTIHCKITQRSCHLDWYATAVMTNQGNVLM